MVHIKKILKKIIPPSPGCLAQVSWGHPEHLPLLHGLGAQKVMGEV